MDGATLKLLTSLLFCAAVMNAQQQYKIIIYGPAKPCTVAEKAKADKELAVFKEQHPGAVSFVSTACSAALNAIAIAEISEDGELTITPGRREPKSGDRSRGV